MAPDGADDADSAEGRAHWQRWHDAYADPASRLSQRLAAVQLRLREALGATPPGPVRLVSACAGQGGDVVGALAGHRRAADVTGRLVELDPDNAEAARSAIAAAGLTGIDVVTRDAGHSDAYAGAVPADVVLLCGIFGNVSDADVETIVRRAAELCAQGATVLWTRHRDAPDLTPAIRGWFAESGFAEVAFDSPDGGSWSVGTARYEGGPQPLVPGQTWFRFS